MPLFSSSSFISSSNDTTLLLQQLFQSISQNDTDTVRNLLSEGYIIDINEQDPSTGDQASHIAARRGGIESMTILLEYDAAVTVRNWAGLTPLGEARMNGHEKMVAFLTKEFAFRRRRRRMSLRQGSVVSSSSSSSSGERTMMTADSHTSLSSSSSLSSWDESIRQELSSWNEEQHENGQKIWIKRNKRGDIISVRQHPPSINPSLIISARKESGTNDAVRRYSKDTFMFDKTKEHHNSKRQYLLERRREWDEVMILRKERDCAVRLQTIWRGRRDRRLKERRELEERCVRVIQRFGKVSLWRCRHDQHRHLQNAATKIQSMYRTHDARHIYHTFLRERLASHRSARTLATHAQSLWRGYVARRFRRRLHFERILPSPTDGRYFNEWNDDIVAVQSAPPRRKRGVWREYTLGGTPSTWRERRELYEGYFRDVRFNANGVTGQVSWTIPHEWYRSDTMEYRSREEMRRRDFTEEERLTAIKLQTLWRARQSRRAFDMIIKAKTICDRAEMDYVNNPNDTKALCNYALYVHVMMNDYVKARGMYDNMMAFMDARGVDNPFVLYSYAIFVAVTHEDDWHEIKHYVYRARMAERRQWQKRINEKDKNDDDNSSSGGDGGGGGETSEPHHRRHHARQRRCIYDLPEKGFYRLAALKNQTGDAWHNYAICRMLVYHDLRGAREAFVRAVRAKPRDDKIVANFDVLIRDDDYLGRGDWSAFDEILEEERRG